MSDDARWDKGAEMFKKAYHGMLPVPDKSSAYAANSIKNLFAEIYTRHVISDRDRRLLVFGALAGVGADPALFEIHARAAVANGEVKAEELEEFLLVLVNYCGYPSVSPMVGVAQKILSEQAKK